MKYENKPVQSLKSKEMLDVNNKCNQIILCFPYMTIVDR